MINRTNRNVSLPHTGSHFNSAEIGKEASTRTGKQQDEAQPQPQSHTPVKVGPVRRDEHEPLRQVARRAAQAHLAQHELGRVAALNLFESNKTVNVLQSIH
jgi:hypothetical protein